MIATKTAWVGHCVTVALLALLVTTVSTNLAAQAPVAKAAAPSDGQESEVPEPKAVKIVAKDGLEIRARFYPGLHGKESAPVMLLHGFQGQGSDLESLAKLLQSDTELGGNAVIVPDMRGHGSSDTIKYPNGNEVKLESNRLRRPDFEQMAVLDLEAIKKFLVEENNNGKLNIQRLCIVALDMSTAVAVNWMARDWSWPPVAGQKQGQDVQLFVFVSPAISFKGYSATPGLSHPDVRSRLPAYLLYGQNDPKGAAAAKRVDRALSKFRLETDKDKKNYFFRGLPTTLQGRELLMAPEIKLESSIAKFIKTFGDRIKEDLPWELRKNPLD